MSKRVQQLFEHVCDLPTEERDAFLNQACDGDQELRNEVESLLMADANAGNFLAKPTADYVDPGRGVTSLGVREGDMVGRYKILQQIGEGGFGVVYMAQQLAPVKRRVALKIIKLGMDTKQVVARFEAERQALAMMSHANIARVFDGGVTESGRPYFVMELVRGDSITTYCNENRMSTRDRLWLFQQVCSAVQHAHQKGIIHRDIKPSNVLITIADDRPVAKVIDFGIAKATNSELTEKTLFTEFRQLIGTPEYMSPEQAERSGVDIDTRTDIYSLGVLLYELLCGVTPFDPVRLRSADWGTLKGIIHDEEPPPPSTAVSTRRSVLATVAKQREIEPRRLTQLLRGELDWIVMKAMEKDRRRRYATAMEFSDDIRRYLHDEPVLAGPPSSLYRWRKFAKRHRGSLIAALSVVATLLMGFGTSLYMMFWALDERDHARAAERQARLATARAERFSAMASSSFVLNDEQFNRSKSQWESEISQLKSIQSASDPRRLIEESHYATWLVSRVIFGGTKEYAEEGNRVAQQLYPRVRETLGLAHPAFLGLCNAVLQSKMFFEKAPVEELLPYYEDIMVSLESIHGPESAIVNEVALEFGTILLAADSPTRAVEQFRRFLATRDDQPPGLTCRVRLMQAKRMIDRAAEKWEGELPTEFAQVLAIYDQHVAGSEPDTPDALSHYIES